jgi:hypothetical protein
MKDFVSGRTRTWPYGTEIKVKVIHAETISRDERGMVHVVIVEDEKSKEGFVLLGENAYCKVGDTRTIRFVKDGRLGGHWRIVHTIEEKPQYRCETCQEMATVHVKVIGMHFCQSCVTKIDARIAEMNRHEHKS